MSQRYFTREQWFALPLADRKRWWKETDYGMKPPSEALLAEFRRMVAETQQTDRPR